MGPNPMGCGGTSPPIGYDLMNDVGIEGDLADQRGPHYFDVRAEAVFLQRDETFGRSIAFTENRLTPNDPVVLSSNQLDYGTQPGFRIIGRYDICPLSVLEFGYTGIFGFSSSASFTDPNPVDVNTGTGNLFSLFSQFGTNPASTTNPQGPMPETERSITQSIAIESDLQSAEISYRRYWLGYIPRVSGTLLAGFRYTKLNEEFEFHTEGEASQTYSVNADNNLAGFQTGADVWICLLQGLRFGAEGKVGLYDNHYDLRNRIVTTPVGTTPPTLFEEFKKDQPALITEASLDLVADILPSLSIRGGYEILFMNSLVLAGDNFNTASPYNRIDLSPNPGLGLFRTPFVDDNGQAFYHGAHIGIEYIW
jgi:hypothetical protein